MRLTLRLVISLEANHRPDVESLAYRKATEPTFFVPPSSSPRTLSTHNVKVIDRGKHTHVTPVRLGDMAGLTIE